MNQDYKLTSLLDVATHILSTAQWRFYFSFAWRTFRNL